MMMIGIVTSTLVCIVNFFDNKQSPSSSSCSVSAQFGCIAEMDEGLLLPVKNVLVIDGVGISGWVFVEGLDDWKFVIIGNERILKANGGRVRPSKTQMDQIDVFVEKCSGQTVLMMAVEDEIEMLLALSDEVCYSYDMTY